MHKSSLDKMLDFRNKYLRGREEEPLVILDLGSSDIGGTYKGFFDSPAWRYIGVDLEPNENVDIVLSESYNWREIESSTIDVLISGQTFEHIEYFWLTVLEIARILKPGGLCCIIAPSSGPEHKYPVDCWRFYPDGFRALARYARLDVLDVKTQWEDASYDEGSSQWKDSVLVCMKPLDFPANEDKETSMSLPPVPVVEPTDKSGLTDIKFNPLKYSKTLLRDPRFLSDMSFWHQHMHFAFALVHMLKPRMFVELGTHKGDSYLAVCQAIDILGLSTKCYAVDTWEGDQHTGSYDISVYESLKDYHDPLYGRFSALIKSTFDQAIEHFSDSSIDLLHIDGLHTYENVKHDFEAWLSKMSERGIVLFHDINVRERDFGVWKLWQELKTKYPSFEFMHGFGLGVLAVGSKVPKPLKEFFAATGETAAVISGYFQMLGSRVTLLFTANKQGNQLADRDRRIGDLENTVKGKEAHTKELESVIGERDRRIGDFENMVKEKDEHIVSLNGVIKEKDLHIQSRDKTIEEKGAHVAHLEEVVEAKNGHITHLEIVHGEKEQILANIYSSHGWRLLLKYYAIRNWLLPYNSKRRLFVKLMFRVLLSPRKTIGKINRLNLKKFIYSLKHSEPQELEELLDQKVNEIVNNHDHGTANESPAVSSVYQRRRMPGVMVETTNRGNSDYIEELNHNLPEIDLKLIAFYLPQFHPIAENDEWWGTGFTEWTNVTKTVPQYAGHHQPRLPGELGFYDLRLPGIQKRQIELAKQYGIHGFCFHFYWFGGKTLLEMPLKQFLSDPDMDFPFCINWANENWTKKWDGLDNEVLIAQKHSPEDDIAFIKHVSKYLKDTRYIRINSRPLLILYRPSLLPDARKTGQRWREWCLDNGIGEIYLALSHSFEHLDPREIGFDAAIECAPNTFPLKDVTGQIDQINEEYSGILLDYNSALKIARDYKPPPYKKFRGICPSWDNEARRPGKSVVLANSSPEAYGEWLENLCNFTRSNFEPDERIIFINAWNEWAEGAYLEPDKRYGYAYLKATADALIEYQSGLTRKKIIYVCHDAHFHGAQLLSLNILKVLKLTFNYDVHCILKSGGELEPEFSKYSTTYNLEKDYKALKDKEKLIDCLYDHGMRDAICSTVVSGDLTKIFRGKGINAVTLVHELPGIIRKMKLENNARLLAEHSSKIVFPSGFVRERFNTVAEIDDERAVILPQGQYKHNKYRGKGDEAKKTLRKRLSLPDDARIVLGVGYGDHRKGVDLFAEAARIVSRKRSDAYFVWVGNLHSEMQKLINSKNESNKNLIHLKNQKDISLFYSGADIYLLTSREDPFPAVVLGAMDAELPVIGFNDAGGFVDIVDDNTGILIDYLDVNAMAKEIVGLLGDDDRRTLLGRNASELIDKNFNFANYVYKLLALLGHDYKKVSVIIPNYNYEKYLKSRLNSVLNQTYPVYEIVFLDDSSTDDSVKIAVEYLKDTINMKLINNKTNSGSVFRQWLKGMQRASGDYIWIAEADDLCENTFLEELMSRIEKDKDVILAYCQSKQMDAIGNILADDYFNYTDDIDKRRWREDYTREGIDELTNAMVVKNIIPNVSAVVFRKNDVSHIADEIINFKIAGDWFFYIWLLGQGKIAYVSKPLNFHRRHGKSVIKSEDKKLHYDEIVELQEYILNNYDVTEEAREKALSYREHLIRYFGL